MVSGAASMISENINARYALLPTFSQDAVSCESACLGYVLGNSQNEQKENAAVDFLKYMLSEKVQKRILEETEQIPANEHVVLDAYKEAMPRLYQAASLVLGADRKNEVPDKPVAGRSEDLFYRQYFPRIDRCNDAGGFSETSWKNANYRK